VYCPVCQSEYPADWKACPKDATALLKSAQIGKYRVEGLLGIGGMGAVYRATNPDIRGSRVAIKVMNPAVANAEQTRERFKREAAAVAALRTSHVVTVYDFSAEPDGTLYLVMEFLDGHTLREEILPSPSYMDLARVQMVMEGALKGLGAAHRVGIVHRDLKPENIYVADTDDGEVPKLLDFGIARVRTQDKHLTHTGSLMGTASYMATEQIAAGVGEIGPWSDVYAMGAILYEMLAGAPAFGGSTVTEVLQRVLKAECVPLASIRPGLNADIYALIERCMSSQPAIRPQDAEAMRIALHTARLVPLGAPIPPPHKTRVDAVPPQGISAGSGSGSRGSGDIAVMATEGRDTPIPNLTPPGLAGTAIGTGAPQLTPPSGHVHGTGPGVGTGTGPGVSTGTGPGVSTGTGPGVSTTGPGVSTTGPIAKPRSKLPLVIGGLAIAGIGTVVAIKMTGGSSSTTPVKDAAPVAQLDASAPPPSIDSAVVAEIDAATEPPLPEFTSAMVRFAAGTYTLGEDPKPSPNALDRKDYAVGEFWIDKEEMTLGALRKALGDPKVGGEKGDTADVPARNVSWAQADAACKALGKRLPTEYEWEVAALDTPNKKELAALKTGSQKLSPAKHAACTPDKCDCSAAGLCDMLGGVVEWTADGPGKKMVRGSGHTVSATEGWMATIHFRQLIEPGADAEVGFRCAWSKGTPPATKPGHAAATPAPPPPPVNKPPPVKRCDIDGMHRAAQQSLLSGQFAAALRKADEILACQPDKRAHAIAGVAACKLGNAARARTAFKNVDDRIARRIRQACRLAGIPL